MLDIVISSFLSQTGRIGASVPADHIIATVIAVIGAYTLPLSLPFAQRYERRVLRRVIAALGIISLVMMAFFSQRNPFDAMHQKRLFVIHSENVGSYLLLAVSSCKSRPTRSRHPKDNFT
jgi:hypothetical protein